MQRQLDSLANKLMAMNAAMSASRNVDVQPKKTPKKEAVPAAAAAAPASATAPSPLTLPSPTVSSAIDMAHLLADGCAELESLSSFATAEDNAASLTPELSQALLTSLAELVTEARKTAAERDQLKKERDELHAEIARHRLQEEGERKAGLDRDAAAALIATLKAAEEDNDSLKEDVRALSLQLHQRDRRLKELALEADEASVLREENASLAREVKERDHELDLLQREVEMMKARLERVAAALPARGLTTMTMASPSSSSYAAGTSPTLQQRL